MIQRQGYEKRVQIFVQNTDEKNWEHNASKMPGFFLVASQKQQAQKVWVDAAFGLVMTNRPLALLCNLIKK